MDSLSVFSRDNFSVRVVYLDGRTAFCLIDCLRSMNSSTTVTAAVKQIIEGLGKEFVVNQPLETEGGRQVLAFVFEEGLTYLLGRSRTEMGKKLNRWIYTEVLPSIRKTGGYQVDRSNSPIDLAKQASIALDFIFSGVTSVKPELLAGLKLNIAKEFCPEIAHQIEPSRQLLIQSTANESKLLTPTEIGKQIDKSARWVNQKLIELGFQTKNNDKKGRSDLTYIPTNRGHEFCDICLATGNGTDSTTYQTLRWYESVITQLAF
ncbi:MAG: BRO-N domain-containing protein [Waterburya sp.]